MSLSNKIKVGLTAFFASALCTCFLILIVNLGKMIGSILSRFRVTLENLFALAVFVAIFFLFYWLWTRVDPMFPKSAPEQREEVLKEIERV